MAVSVVGGTLLLIAQDSVGLAALFKALLGLVIARIAIRVILQRQFAIGALDLRVARAAGNAEYFVVIAFYVSSQCSKDRRSGRPPRR